MCDALREVHSWVAVIVIVEILGLAFGFMALIRFIDGSSCREARWRNSTVRSAGKLAE